MSWAAGPLAGFDIESTDRDPRVARIVTASIVLIEPGRPAETVDWLVAVDEPIPAEAAGVHGITTDYAREHGRPLGDVVPEISGVLTDVWLSGGPVVAFNACYDCRRTGPECRDRRVVAGAPAAGTPGGVTWRQWSCRATSSTTRPHRAG